MVESSRYKVIVQTNHSAILDIMRQSSITTTTSIMRMNVRLIRASQFLRQFPLDVRHKLGKEHIVPDALSRLASASTKASELTDNYSELDCLFNALYVRINDEFYDKVLKGYNEDLAWRRITKIIDNPDNATTRKLLFVRGRNLPAIDLDPYFSLRLDTNYPPLTSLPSDQSERSTNNPETIDNPENVDSSENDNSEIVDNSNPMRNSDIYDDLIYYVNKFSGYYRVYIPDHGDLIKQVLEVIYGNRHPGYDRCFNGISKIWFIRRLGRYIREFLRYCPEYLVYQTRRHRLYSVLEPIQSPKVPFHTLTLDFILALPKTDNGLDYIISVTYKYSKRITLIAGKSI